MSDTATPENTRPQAPSWRRRLIAALLIAVAASAIVMTVMHTLPIFISAENWARDWRVSVLGPNPPVRDDIVVLGIDEDTLDTLPYRSPVDRGFLAELLNYLAEAKVRAVGLDLLFDRPTEPVKDKAFLEALRNFPAPLVIVWADADENEQILTEKEKQYMDANFQGVQKGYANLIRDEVDGVTRWINVRHEAGKEDYLGFPAAIAQTLGHTLPTTNIALDYATWPDGEESAFATFSAGAFKFLPKQWFASKLAGKIVMIGGVLREIDRYPTPFVAGLGVDKGTIPGVVIHAHALAQLLDGRRLKTADLAREGIIVAGSAMIGAALAAMAVPIWIMLTAGAAIFAGLVVSSFAAYPAIGVLLPVFSPGLGFLAALMVMSFYQQRRFQEERTFIRGALSRYVAEDVVKQLESEPWRLKLGGERRNLTFLFTDIAGFTSLSEQTEPAVLVAALNQYLDGASRIILDHGGTIDKYIGDAIVVVFGAFSENENHARQAIDCALALDSYAEDYAAARRAEGLDFGNTRIGVNTGAAIIGNFGGDLRFDYTVIGDAVNTAARLEGANKYFGTRICVSGTTMDSTTAVPSRMIGDIILKGKAGTTRVYQPVSESEAKVTWLIDYADAYSLLASKEPAATPAFEALALRAPDDPLVRFHLDRLKAGETGAEIELVDK